MVKKEDLERAVKKAWKKRESKTREELIEEAKAIDKAKDRSRKTLTKKEKNDIEYEKMLNYRPEVKVEQPIVKKESDEWDVKIGDPIEYFDPNLSYELTGYRPITKDKGLDFNPKVFTEAADTYRKTGRYTQLVPGTFAHRAHWQEEFRRCRDGVTIGKYTLTGENYFFLNYYRLLSVLGDSAGQEVRNEDFPGFLAKQYEFFHYIDLCRKAGFDICAFKARATGASEISASNVACAYTFHKDSYNIITAFDEKYVQQTLDKVWQELDFLNTQTEGAFRHLRMRIDTAMKKKASKIDKDKNETGWGSIVEGITADKPRKLRGARVYNLIFEEAGSFKTLVDTYIESRALVFVGGSYRIGCRTIQGTSSGENTELQGLKKIFYNPKQFLVLPYKHNYTKTGETAFTGYFIPSYTIWFGTPDNPGFDSRGVVDEERAKAYYLAYWNTITDPQHLLRDRAEYCFTPEDAFLLEGSKIFDSEKLSEQKINIEQHLVETPKNARLIWPYSKELGGVDRSAIPTVEFTNSGKIKIAELPIKDDNGKIPDNLYVIGIDAIDSASAVATGQTDLSKYAIIVFRRQYGLQPPKIVALYKERPDDPSDAHDTALKLAEFYNAKVLFEATRISIFNHFKRYNQLGYFLRRPKSTLTNVRQNANQFGCPATQAIIQHQIELIQQYVFDYYDQIDFIEVVDELLTYSYENKTKFDLTVALAMALLADEDLLGKNPKLEQVRTLVRNVGYYINQYGQKEYGIIPDNQEPRTIRYEGWFRERRYMSN